ncbi:MULTISPECIES: glycosyltransferase [Olivibacter]|uniref:Glycosyltransferase n=1 Tax=Olivibacter jilunii TaxID=985016 RepID=A0ABW6BB33_9SPHI|nr:glycosyltransferase [Olivibacter sp. UJ_SKK_5.1]MDX3912857.1 glycosyltransferase [Pseudosphingobacterium sp.]
MKELSNTFVSIIIPTYRDWSRLALCISHLKKQSWPMSKFEVIVVNNDPSDSAPSPIINDLPENFCIINEGKSGSYAARNAGIRLAKGNVLGFTDSDCIPDKNWIYNAIRLFNDKPCDRIGGAIEVFYENEQRPTDAELYEKVFAFKQAETINASKACVTGNMFSHRYVFDKVGLFNENLFSGGDYEWARRASDCGFSIIHGEDVKIFHPARKSMQELIKKAKRVGGGTAHQLLGEKRAAIRDYLNTFEPSRYALHMIRLYGSELSLWQKLKVFSLRVYIKHTMNLEKMKVVFGKKANRE